MNKWIVRGVFTLLFIIAGQMGFIIYQNYHSDILIRLNQLQIQSDKILEKVNKHDELLKIQDELNINQSRINEIFEKFFNQVENIKIHIKTTSDKASKLWNLKPISWTTTEKITYNLYWNCAKYNRAIDSALAQITAEALCHPAAEGEAGEHFLTQIKESTWRACGCWGNFNSWEDMLELGFKIMHNYINIYGSEWKALVRYNGGTGIYKCDSEAIARAEGYANRIMKLKGQISKKIGAI